jgi:Flp pilus assembly pilin Flp
MKRKSETGQSILEYALLLCLIAGLALIVLLAMSGRMSSIWSKTGEKVQQVAE